MSEDEVLAAIIKDLVATEPALASGWEWDTTCAYCGGEAPQWPPGQASVQHEADCPWRRLKEYMENAGEGLGE